MLIKSTLALATFLVVSAVSASDGDLGSHFGAGGVALSGSLKPYYTFPSKPALQPDGKIPVCDTFVLGKCTYELHGTQGFHYFTGVVAPDGRIFASGEVSISTQFLYGSFLARIENELIFVDRFE